LNNAVKFTPEGGEIRLSVDVATLAGDAAALTAEVRDNGIGIAADQLDKVFDPFEQADGGLTRTCGGTGLGLTISKKIVDLMGGDIRVRSEVGRGTAFAFTVPVTWGGRLAADRPGPHAAPSAPAGRAWPDWKDKAILLVEDLDVNREVVMGLLRKTGLVIDWAGDGREAVETFRRQGGKYDLVLMDVQMPNLDGLGATRLIRALPAPPNAATVPIIAMTANAFKEDIRDCLASGMNGHIAKPVDLRDMLTTLGRYLQGGRDECSGPQKKA
jgi:CheY-like chemotaxis protein